MLVFSLGADFSVRLGGGAAAPRGALCERLERWGRTETVPRGTKGAWEGLDGVVSPLSVVLPPQQVHSDWGHIAHAGSPGAEPHSVSLPTPAWVLQPPAGSRALGLSLQGGGGATGSWGPSWGRVFPEVGPS